MGPVATAAAAALNVPVKRFEAVQALVHFTSSMGTPKPPIDTAQRSEEMEIWPSTL